MVETKSACEVSAAERHSFTPPGSPRWFNGFLRYSARIDSQPLPQFAPRDAMLQDDVALFVADLDANDWIGLVPVDQDRAEVGVEILQTNTLGVDLVRESSACFGHVAARSVEVAAGDVKQRVA